jgi:hypothetical protein
MEMMFLRWSSVKPFSGGSGAGLAGIDATREPVEGEAAKRELVPTGAIPSHGINYDFSRV